MFSKIKWLAWTCFESYNRSSTLLCFLIKSFSSLGHVLVQTKLFLVRFSSWKRQIEPGKVWSRREIEPRFSFVLSAVNWKWIHCLKNSCKQPSESLVLIFLEQFVLETLALSHIKYYLIIWSCDLKVFFSHQHISSQYYVLSILFLSPIYIFTTFCIFWSDVFKIVTRDVFFNVTFIADLSFRLQFWGSFEIKTLIVNRILIFLIENQKTKLIHFIQNDGPLVYNYWFSVSNSRTSNSN